MQEGEERVGEGNSGAVRVTNRRVSVKSLVYTAVSRSRDVLWFDVVEEVMGDVDASRFTGFSLELDAVKLFEVVR